MRCITPQVTRGFTETPVCGTCPPAHGLAGLQGRGRAEALRFAFCFPNPQTEMHVICSTEEPT